MQGEQSSVSEM